MKQSSSKEVQLNEQPPIQRSVYDPENYNFDHLKSKILQADFNLFIKDYEYLTEEVILKKFITKDFINTLVHKKVIKPLTEQQQKQLTESIINHNKNYIDKVQTYFRLNIVQHSAITELQKANIQKKKRIQKKLKYVQEVSMKIADKIKAKRLQQETAKFIQYRGKVYKPFQPNMLVQEEVSKLMTLGEKVTKEREEKLRINQQKLTQSVANSIYKLDFSNFQRRFQNK